MAKEGLLVRNKSNAKGNLLEFVLAEEILVV